MSRSNLAENGTPNPATKWFEWNGENGTIRYYDKDAKKNVEVGSEFTFLLLDRLGTVGGWHEASQSGIYANEVKDTRQDVLIVKAFKGGTLAEGLYKDIKDRVATQGGQFVASCYIAFKNGGTALAIGGLKFKGAALGAWMDFEKAHRTDLYTQAIRIHGFTEGKRGRIVFRVPTLSAVVTSAETHAAAMSLDRQVQDYLQGYFTRTTRDQAQAQPHHVRDEDILDEVMPEGRFDESSMPPLDDSDIPFAWLLPLMLPLLGSLAVWS